MLRLYAVLWFGSGIPRIPPGYEISGFRAGNAKWNRLKYFTAKDLGEI